MRAGEKDGLMPVKFLMEKIPGQCEGIVAADPFMIPTKKYPASIPVAEQARLTAAILQADPTEVIPAYRQFADFVRTDYAPKGRTQLSIESLPYGKARYAFAVRQGTTINIPAAEVHQIGLDEVKRITAEMNALAVKQGFKDVAAWRVSINNDPRWKPKSADQIVDDFRKYIAQMQPKLPELFTLLPKQPVTVEAMPAFRLRRRRTTARGRRMAAGRGGWWWRWRIRPAERWYWMRRWRTTREFPGTTCRSRTRSS